MDLSQSCSLDAASVAHQYFIGLCGVFVAAQAIGRPNSSTPLFRNHDTISDACL
jgi:hypothetical protein